MKLLALAALWFPALAFAGSDTKKLSSADGACSVSVPTVSKLVPVVSHPVALTSFEDVKSGGRSLYKGKVIKDSPTELEIEGPSAINGKPSVYRAIASGKTFCLVEVDYDASTADDARKIAHSLAAR